MTKVLDDITPLIITFNEAANIRRTLDKLSWARRVVVVDSGSTDDTLSILEAHAQVEVFHRPFDDFASQCNFGLTLIRSQWVLSLDADYELSDELIRELQSLSAAADTAGYRAQFIYRIYGRALRGSLYPPRVVLYRKDRAAYKNEGHGHRVAIDGPVLALKGRIYHDDRKPLSRWLSSQQSYASREAAHLLSCEHTSLSMVDRIRRAAWPAPLAVLIYTLIGKGCLLDGWPGWFYALQRTLAEVLISLEILDRRLRRRNEAHSNL